MSFTFNVDSSVLALDWLYHNRELWDAAYTVRIEPVAYPVHPITGQILHRSVMLITVQGEHLPIPDDAVVGVDRETGYREGLLYVSEELAISWCDTAKHKEAES